MPVGFNSPTRNLFLLGSSGGQVVTNFFKTIDQSAGSDGSYEPDEIKYNFADQKFLLAGSALDSQTKRFGWFEKRDDTGTAEWDVRVEAGVGVNTFLRAMELDDNDNLIVVGETGDVPWIAKYSNGGVIDWQSSTFSGDVAYFDVAFDSNGEYYACGNTPTNNNESVAFVEKFDANGNPGWGKSAMILGGDIRLEAIESNSRGEVVAGGRIEDETRFKAYLVKIDTNTGEVLWDRTIESRREDGSGNPEDTFVKDVFIDSNDQIYVVGRITTIGTTNRSFIIKYSPEGNIIWQKETVEGIEYYQVKSDGETQQTVVFGVYQDVPNNDEGGLLSKYSKDGTLVWRRTLFSSFNNSNTFGERGKINLDADPSFYYLLYTDGPYNTLNGTPESYTYGKVSSSGNGLGGFEYEEGTGQTIYYNIQNTQDKIGKLSDGSVRNDTSDLVTYPFNANKLLFDDLATQVANKKIQMDSSGNFEYSGSPAIRPADFQELNLLGGVGITSETVSTSVSSVDISGTTMNSPQWTSTSGLTGTLQIDLSGGTTDALTSFVNNAVSGDSVSGSDLWNYSSVTVTLTSSFTEVSTDVWEASSTSSSNPGSDFGLNYYEISTDAVPSAPYPLTLYFPYTASVTTTTWGDQSGKGNDALALADLSEPFPGGGSTKFSGGNLNIFVTNSEYQFDRDFSIEFFFKGSTQSSSGATFIEWWDEFGVSAPQYERWAIKAESGGTGNMQWVRSGTTRITTSGINVFDNQWHHHAIMRFGSTITYYIDGVSRGTESYGTTLSLGQNLLFGASAQNTSTNQIIGNMSNVRITRETLFTQATYQLPYPFAGGFTPPTTPLESLAVGTYLLTLQNGSYKNNATNYTFQSLTPSGDVNSSLYWEFSGTNDYILPDITAEEIGNEFTIEGWFRPSSFPTSPNYDYLISVDRSSGSINWALCTNAIGQLRKLGPGGDQTGSFGTLSTNTWYHIVMTHRVSLEFGANSISQFSIYLNGALVNTTNDDYDSVNKFGKLTIGNKANVYGSKFNGDVGEVRLYQRLLTPAQIFQNYNATREKYTGVPASTDPGLTSTRTPA